MAYLNSSPWAGGKCCFKWTEWGLLWLHKNMTCDPELRPTPNKLSLLLTFSIPPPRWLWDAAAGWGAAGGVLARKHGPVTKLHTFDGQDPAQAVPGERPPQCHPQPRPSHSQSDLGSFRSPCSCRFLSHRKLLYKCFPLCHFSPNHWFPLVLQPRYLNEALLLMAKVHYVQGRYRDAQGMCARVGLEELTRDEQPTYHLRLLAEAFVIKGTYREILVSYSLVCIFIFSIITVSVNALCAP